MNSQHTIKDKIKYCLEYYDTDTNYDEKRKILHNLRISQRTMGRWKGKLIEFKNIIKDDATNANQKKVCGIPYASKLKCIQFIPDHSKKSTTPILPPDSQLSILSEKVIPIPFTDATKAREHYNITMSSKLNTTKQRKYLKGSKYINTFSPRVEIDVKKFKGAVDLEIKLNESEISKLKVRDLSNEIDFLKTLHVFNQLKPTEEDKKKADKLSRGRQHCGDGGSMFMFGCRNKGVPYASSRQNHYNVEDMSRCARIVLEKYFRKEVNEIMTSDKNQEVDTLGGTKGFGAYTIVSKDLVNAPNLDVNDTTVSITVFNEKHPGSASGWYFVLPNTTLLHGKDNQAVVIKLFHGCALSWDGRKIFHCTALKEIGNNNHVYGNFWSSKKY